MTTITPADTPPLVRPTKSPRSILPGLVLSIAVTAIAYGIERAEWRLFGKAWLEALVVAIVLGSLVRSLWTPGPAWRSGIGFSAKYLLEFAVVLLGASVSGATVLAAGLPLLIGIAAVVAVVIPLSFGIGRLLGLPTRMALLVACGNSICGNSAIAAVAPVIGADSEEVASSIAFTAVLGVAVVLGLPLLGIALGMSALAYGAFAGLTVYAVPQVIAAASPLGATAVQMGTLVKLMRVLMLGPVCLVLSFIGPRLAPRPVGAGQVTAGEDPAKRLNFATMVPWFIIGFIVMALARSLGLLPTTILAPTATLATVLTVISMAALGLGVDLRTVASAGGRVTAAVILSLVLLGAISIALIGMLHLA
ncbi:MAG: YeiH family putative sulfate export transporter [Proteobacteria bacterium]|nr:YeiH family putative sulfate export transporter [Pseudomonadota bacterium]